MTDRRILYVTFASSVVLLAVAIGLVVQQVVVWADRLRLLLAGVGG